MIQYTFVFYGLSIEAKSNYGNSQHRSYSGNSLQIKRSNRHNIKQEHTSLFFYQIVSLDFTGNNIEYIPKTPKTGDRLQPVNVSEFVDKIRTTGKITQANYNEFVETISATGNIYNVEMELQIKDENLGKKVSQAQASKIGENVYYSIFTSQIEEIMDRQRRSLLL